MKTSDRKLDRDAAQLHQALADLVRVYQFRDRKSVCYHDISVTQCYALDALVRADRNGDTLSLGELAAELYLDKSTASRVVDSLERKGYATRSADPDDARVRLLAPTAAGKRLRTRIERELIETQKELIRGIAPDVRQATAQLIASLARSASDRFASAKAVAKCDA